MQNFFFTNYQLKRTFNDNDIQEIFSQNVTKQNENGFQNISILQNGRKPKCDLAVRGEETHRNHELNKTTF